MGISWQNTEDRNCIGRKYIDKSIFKYGIHIPLEYRDKFFSNIKNESIELGKSQIINLIFDDYTEEVEIRNINSKGRSETIQIRYDSNKVFREYLKNKFNYTYKLIENEESDIDIDEYIEFYKSEDINSFYIKYHLHNDESSLDEVAKNFINTIRTTSMSKSYKIPLLWAFYNNGNMKLKIDEDDIFNSFKLFYNQANNGVDLQGSKTTQDYKTWGKKEFLKLAKNAPIKYLSEGTGEYFYKQDNLFCISEILRPYIKDKIFINEFKDAVEGLENKYYKRGISKVKERNQKYMDLNELIISFEKNYDFNDIQDEKLRQDFANKFPLEDLKNLELERYALGKQSNNLCWWLEYNTIPLGSIKGGNAKKFKIYYANKENKWIYPNNFSSVEEAWIELRDSIDNFVNKFKLGQYESLNDSGLVTSMNMFKTKLLYMYFPEKLLPVYSIDHIQKLLMYFGYGEEVKLWDIIKANMELKAFQDKNEIFKNWNGLKFMRFIYREVLPNMNEDEPVDVLFEDIGALDGISKVNSYINGKGYNYTHDQLSNLYLSIKTKPFVILAGISGTGKSKIVRLLAESLGATPDNSRYQTISVRPDWNDNSDLIGYKNLKDQFIEGQLTKIIKEAIKLENKNKPYFICLDEMNLARVEYYFSDYLSIIESRKKQGQDIITDNIVNETELTLHIPDNIYLIGTVNMDDTTFQFSRKVLDRANTIEFSDVDLENLFIDTIEEKIEPILANNDFLKTTYLKTTDIEEEHREYARIINKKIIEINEILKKSQKQFAYRVRDEILFYMIENKKAELLHEDIAFDYQIMQKILPAINGSENSIKEILVDLFNYVCDKKVINDTDDINIDEAQNYLQNAKYKNSAQKIIYMLKGYQNDGYISFWC